jgi:hypothetical protein
MLGFPKDSKVPNYFATAGLFAASNQDEMNRLLSTASLAALFATVTFAAEVQGVLTDWDCTQDMVRYGREQTLRKRRSCSLAQNFRRSAYGLITDDKKSYKIDPQSNDRVIQILSDSPNKDSLQVVISGDLNGNTLKINTISIL